MFKAAVSALALLTSTDVAAQNQFAGPPEQPRFQAVRWDFECNANFKVRNVRIKLESSEKGTRYDLLLKSILVNDRSVAKKDFSILQKIINKFDAFPQALLMCNSEGASLYIGPDYRKADFKNGKFEQAPHVVDVLTIRPDGFIESGQFAISK